MAESTARVEKVRERARFRIALLPLGMWPTSRWRSAWGWILSISSIARWWPVSARSPIAARKLAAFCWAGSCRVLPPVVVIEDYERVACDYSRGPLYRLGTGDKDRFDAILRQRAVGSTQELAVVGMFRSNTRKGLSLDPEDAAFFAERFHDPQQVILLVRPFATKPSVAGFFIRGKRDGAGGIQLPGVPLRPRRTGAAERQPWATSRKPPRPCRRHPKLRRARRWFPSRRDAIPPRPFARRRSGGSSALPWRNSLNLRSLFPRPHEVGETRLRPVQQPEPAAAQQPEPAAAVSAPPEAASPYPAAAVSGRARIRFASAFYEHGAAGIPTR